MTIHSADSGSERDLRLDLFKGIANWAIFLDHVPNNVVAWITARNYGFSDAAELFVFVSGYTVAFVYARTLHVRGFIAASIGILGRVWQIYVAYILLFVFYVVAIGFVAQRYGHAHLLDEFNIRQLIANPVEFLKHGLLLEYRPLNLDVLPLYIVLMAPFPPVLWLLARSPHLALGASIALYAISRILGWNLPGYPTGTWYFNPFTWQLLFVIGAWAALADRRMVQSISRSHLIIAGAFVIMIVSAFITLPMRLGHDAFLPEALRSFFEAGDKTQLATYRIIHFLAAAIIVAWAIPQHSEMLRWPIWRPIIVCGQRSLEVFCAGVFFSFLAYFAVHLVSNAFLFQLFVSAAGIAGMIAVAYFRSWSKQSRAGVLKFAQKG